MGNQALRFVFLDRDGVLNVKMPEGAWVTRWADFVWLPGAREAVARLKRAGLIVILVTNQRGIAVGLYTREQLEDIHECMLRDLSLDGGTIDAIYYCPHDKEGCDCRKPKAGLFIQAFERFPLANAGNSLMIGDSLADIRAGKRVGLKTIFIHDEADPRGDALIAAELADGVAASLMHAVETHLGLTR